MTSVASRRRVIFAGAATAAWLLLFFATVAWFLGPDLTKARNDKLIAFALHIGGGSVALLTAPFQFIAPIRNRYRRYHRFSGYAFVGGSAAAILGYLVIMPGETDMFWLSQLVAVSIWAACVVVAILAIRRKHVLTHQHNMARAFVIAAYFVVVRIIDRHLMWALEPFSKVEGARLAHSDWLAWVVPLILVEIWYGRKWDRLLKRRERPHQPHTSASVASLP
ncbi:MAG: DUF2306 domain-containing protein [Sphingomonas sp.]|nr:DUF2306 domain-containing protein [Sphingomonas sp.]